MKKWEYQSLKCSPEEMFEELNIQGLSGWEFVFLITMQKMIQHPAAPLFGSQQKPPEVITVFILLFKREKE